MAQENASLETIEDFLAQQRIAMVGLSRDPKDFSWTLFHEFVRRGYDVLPVNPNAAEIDGRPCFPRVQNISPPPDAAIVMTSATACEAVARDCAEAGIRRIWLYAPGGGESKVNAKAVEFCRANGIQVIPGECPYMFWRGANFGHRLHGWLNKISGHYPRHERAA